MELLPLSLNFFRYIVGLRVDISNSRLFVGHFEAKSGRACRELLLVVFGQGHDHYAPQPVPVISNNGAINLSRLIKNNYSNIAQLKELTTIPPMSAERHAAIMRQRIAHRRIMEEAKDLKLVADPLFDSQ